MNHHRLWMTLAASLMLSAAVSSAASAQTVDAVASFTVLGDIVKNVGGDHVNVKSLVPPNGDPHDYEPTPDDAKAIKNAKVTFISGDGLESWFQRLAKASGAPVAPVTVSTGIKTHTFVDDGKTVTDPHVWNSVTNVEIWVANIEQALAKADPDDASDFKANAGTYLAKLKELDTSIREKILATPKDARKILTSHDAFGYYGKEYGIEFMAPLGVSTEKEASAAGVAKLINQIKKEKIKYYFFENSNDAKLIKQVGGATGAQPGGELYPEALSPADGPAPNYIQMMTYNTDQLVSAMSK